MPPSILGPQLLALCVFFSPLLKAGSTKDMKDQREQQTPYVCCGLADITIYL
jgi:hypothetical protein